MVSTKSLVLFLLLQELFEYGKTAAHVAHIFLSVVVDERLEVVEEIDFFGMLRKTQVGLLFFQLLFFLKADFLGHFEDFTILLTPIRECSIS